MVRIHVRMNVVGIRLASADDDDASSWKIFLKNFVGRRIGIVDMDFANEVGVSIFASEDADEVRTEKVVSKTLVSHEYHGRRPEYVTKVYEHLTDMVARQLYVTFGRKISVIGKFEIVGLFFRHSSARTFGKQLRNPHRQYWGESKHATIRIVFRYADWRVERYRTMVSNHGRKLYG